jgi:hypothetical protein
MIKRVWLLVLALALSLSTIGVMTASADGLLNLIDVHFYEPKGIVLTFEVSGNPGLKRNSSGTIWIGGNSHEMVCAYKKDEHRLICTGGKEVAMRFEGQTAYVYLNGASYGFTVPNYQARSEYGVGFLFSLSYSDSGVPMSNSIVFPASWFDGSTIPFSSPDELVAEIASTAPPQVSELEITYHGVCLGSSPLPAPSP